jgi:hypothetical protein
MFGLGLSELVLVALALAAYIAAGCAFARWLRRRLR